MTDGSPEREPEELELASDTVADLEVSDGDLAGALRPDPSRGTCDCTDVPGCSWGCGGGTNDDMGC